MEMSPVALISRSGVRKLVSQSLNITDPRDPVHTEAVGARGHSYGEIVRRAEEAPVHRDGTHRQSPIYVPGRTHYVSPCTFFKCVSGRSRFSSETTERMPM
jgi:hypothetical protein